MLPGPHTDHAHTEFAVLRRVRALGWALMACGIIAAIAHVAVVAVVGEATLLASALYLVPLAAAAAVCFTRAAVVPKGRAIWLLFGACLVAWIAGNATYDFYVARLDSPPYPSDADVFWLLFYPLAYVALLLTLRERVAQFRRSVVVDGILAGLAIAALGGAVILPPVLDASAGSAAALATALAYPLADFVLLGFVCLLLSVNGWRPDRTLALLALALVLEATTDSLYLYQVATGTFHAGSFLFDAWLVVGLLIAWAAWQQPREGRIVVRARAELVMPALFTLLAVAVLVHCSFTGTSRVGAVLAALALLAAVVRLVLTLRESQVLAELDRLKDSFVASVSHELRTPLTSIQGYLELVLEGESGELTDDQRAHLAIVDRNAKRLLRVVGDLLFVAQVDAGMLAIERAPLDLAALAADCVEAARPFALEKGVALSLSAESGPELSADAARLGQVLDNLVSNALKFTPAGGRVEVRTSASDGRAALEVADTGAGIPTADLKHLFERFYRTSAATKQGIPGTGLGLGITKAIVEAHGGTIGVESEEGAGTTFRIELPLAGRAEAAARLEPMEVALTRAKSPSF